MLFVLALVPSPVLVRWQIIDLDAEYMCLFATENTCLASQLTGPEALDT